MRELTNPECFFIFGGDQTTNTVSDSSKILTEDDVRVLATVGSIGGAYFGAVSWPAHPVIGLLAGAGIGASFLPVIYTLGYKGWIWLYQITGVI